MLVCGHCVTYVYVLGVGWKEMEKCRNGGEKASDTKANSVLAGGARVLCATLRVGSVTGLSQVP